MRSPKKPADPRRAKLFNLIEDRALMLETLSRVIGRRPDYLANYIFNGTPGSLPVEILRPLAEILRVKPEELQHEKLEEPAESKPRDDADPGSDLPQGNAGVQGKSPRIIMSADAAVPNPCPHRRYPVTAREADGRQVYPVRGRWDDASMRFHLCWNAVLDWVPYPGTRHTPFAVDTEEFVIKAKDLRVEGIIEPDSLLWVVPTNARRIGGTVLVETKDGSCRIATLSIFDGLSWGFRDLVTGESLLLDRSQLVDIFVVTKITRFENPTTSA